MNLLNLVKATVATTLSLTALVLSSNQALAQPAPACGFTIDTAPMIGEDFTGSITLNNTGDAPGFQPGFEIIAASGLSLTGASFQGLPGTIVEVGTFQGSALANPLTGASTSGPLNSTLYFITIPVSSQPGGGPALAVDLTFAQSGTVVGTEYAVSGACQFAFGTDASNDHGTDPVLTTAEIDADVRPVFAKFTKIARQLGAAVMVQGESFPASWELVIDVADGRTLDTATVTEAIPDGFIITGFSSTNGTATLTSPAATFPLATGADLQIAVAGVTGTALAEDETIIIEGYFGEFEDDGVTPLIDPCTGIPAPRVNTATFADIASGADTQDDVTVEFPTVVVAWAILETIDNQSRPGETPRPGDTLSMDLDIVVSDYFGFTGNTVASTLQDGLSYNDDSTPVDIGDTDNGPTWSIDFVLPDLVGPVVRHAQEVTFTMNVDETYDDATPVLLGQTILTSHSLTGTPDTACGVERTDTEAAGPVDDSVPLAGGKLTKSVFAINGNTADIGPELDPTDTVTYRLRLETTHGDAANTVISDYFPLPLHVISAVSGSAGTPFDGGTHPIQFGPDHATDGSGAPLPVGTVPAPSDIAFSDVNNSVDITFGPIQTNPTSPVVIDVLITIPVEVCQYGDIKAFTNIGLASFNDGASNTAFGLTNVSVRQADIAVHHGAVAIDGDNNAPELTGPAGLNPSNVAITNATLSSTPVNANAVADAGDVVTFAAIIENTSDHTAFDLGLSVSVDAGYEAVSLLNVVDGDGDALPFTGNPLTGQAVFNTLPGSDDRVEPGDSIVVVLYTAQLVGAVEGGGSLPNTLTVERYATTPSGSGTACDSVPPLTDSARSDVPNLGITKSRAGDNPSAIRCSNIQYTVTLTVPEGVHEDVRIVDTLTANHFGVTDIVSATASSDLGILLVPTPTFNATRNVVTWDFGTITNSNRVNGDAETITLVYEAVIRNRSEVNRGDNLTNNAVVTWSSDSRSNSAGTSGLIVSEPTLVLGSQSLAPNPADGGDTVLVSFVIQHSSASNQDAFDADWQLVLPAELTNLSNFTVTGLAPTTQVATAAGASLTWSSFPMGQTTTVSYTVDVVPGVGLGNTADAMGAITWTSCAGIPPVYVGLPNSSERDGSGSPTRNDYRATGQALNIAQPAPAKSLVGTQTAFNVGEGFEYELQLTIPEGSSATVTATDTLPTGLVYLGETTGSFSNPGNVQCGVSACGSPVVTEVGNQLTFTWAAVDNPPDADTEAFTWRIRVRPDNVIGNQQGDSYTNSFAAGGVSVVATSVTLTEPELTVAVAPNTTTVDAGDTVTYTFTVSNTGDGPAHETVLDATFGGLAAAGSATVVSGGCTVGVTNPGTDQAQATISTLAPGQVCVFTVTGQVPADVSPGAAVGGVLANATWTSLPGVSADERTGSDGEGNGLNNYAASGATPSALSVPGATVAKTLASTGSTVSGASAAAPGETMVFNLAVTMPQGQADLVLTDTLPAGLTIQSVAIPVLGNFSVANNPPTFAGGVMDLGSVSLPADGTTASETLTVVVTTVAGSPQLVDGTNAVALSVDGTQADTANLAVDFVNPGPTITLSGDTSPEGGVNTVITATVANTGDAPVCDTDITVVVPAVLTLRDPSTDGLDNDASGGIDEAAEAGFVTATNTLTVPVVGCIDPGASRALPFVVVAPLGGSAPASISATLGSYQSLPAADGGGISVDPNADGIDTNGVGGVDTDGDDTSLLQISPETSPLPGDDTVTTPAGTAVTVDVLPNDAGIGVTFNGVVTAPRSGDVSVNPDGTLLYLPNPGFTGVDTFTYEVCDANSNCATAVVVVNVTPIDRGPIAHDDKRATGVDTDVTIAVLDNDEDPEGGVLSIVTTGNPLNGSVTANGDGTVTYTPNAGFTGTDTFTYTVADDEGNLADATVTIEVTDANTNPVANDDSETTAEDTAVTIDVVDNDADADLDALSVATIVQPSNGTVVDNGDGTVTYTPQADFTGDDTFVYSVCDASGCDDATVTVTVTPSDDPPIALDDNAVTPLDTAVTIDAFANDIEPDGDILSVGVTVPPANGSVSETSPGVFEYTPVAGFTGRDTFSYEACDPAGNCSSAYVVVDVGQTNAPPEVSDDSATVPWDVSSTVDIGSNDVGDSDGDMLYLQATTSPQNGFATIDFATGEATYLPNPGFTGADFFTYTVCDEHGACATARVDLLVEGNQAPDAQPDAATTAEDVPVVIAVLANDSDPEGTALTVFTLASPPTNGTAVINADNTVTYTPNPNFVGVDTFEYTVCDADNWCATETVTVTVTPVNDPPVPNDDGFAVPGDATTTLDVVANDSDADGDALTVLANSEPANGGIVVNGDGTIDYTPDAGFVGTDTFTYLVCDTSDECAQATVTLQVGGANGNPDAVDDSETTVEDFPVTIDVITNDTDPDGDDLTVAAVTIPGNGSASNNGDGTVTYTPDPGFVGSDTFSYTVCDPAGACVTAVVTVDVTAVNDGPSALDDRVSTIADTAVTVSPLTNDADPDGDVLTVTAVTQPANGTAVLNSDGTVTYTPATGFTGEDTFTYTVCDPSGACDQAEVTVAVGLPANEEPTAVDDVATADTAVAQVIEVLINDTDPDGDTLVVAAATKPSNGTVSVNADGTVTYTSDAGFEGVDTFTYTACDLFANCDTATVTVTVGPPVNAPPVGGDDEALTDEDVAVVLNVLANDSDADGETLTVAGTSTPANGTTTVNADGTITYVPNPGFNGTDSFTYQVCDPNNACDTVDVTVEVVPANDAPIANNDAWTVPGDADTVLAVTANDSDPEGEPLTLLVTSAPLHGAVTNNGDGTVTYTPTAGYTGADTISYTVCDPSGACDSAVVTLDVGGTNANPDAVDDSATTAEDTAVVIDVADNDTDGDGDTLTISAVTVAANGSVVDNGDGTLTYTPNPGFNGSDTFAYTTCDSSGCDTANVVVDVTPTDDAPVAIDDVVGTGVGVPAIFDPTVNDLELDGEDLVVTSVTQPDNGTATVNADGTVTYTPDAGFSGIDTFTYSACDATSCDTATVTVFVEPDPNGAPTAEDDTEATALDTPVTVGVLANDSDPEGGTLSVTEVVDPANGSVVLNTDGTITYTPDAGFQGTDSFVYEICDDHGQCDRATVTLTVGDANATPVGGDDEAETPEGSAVTLNVLANDADADGDALTVAAVSTPANGTAVINADSTVTYTPNPGFTGTDVFTYDVCDDSGACDTVVVTVNVRDEAMAPVAVDDAWSVPNDATSALSVLDNDSDADGDTLTVKQVTVAPTNGTAVLNSLGGIDYTPNAGFVGTDTFTYEMCDGTGRCDTAVVTLDVGGANTNPDALNDTATTPVATPVVIDVADNDTDVDADTLTVGAISPPLHGAVVDNGDGTVTYTPQANFAGTDTFTYTICDGNGGCDTATVTVDVTGAVDAAPVAVDDVEQTLLDTPVTFDPTANDVDSGGDSLVVGSATQPADGTVTVNPDGTVTYTPDAGFEGVDTFEYTACDPAGQCAAASVTVYVDAAPNAPPVATDDQAEATPDTPVIIPVTANDTDPDGGTLVVTEITQPKYGTVTLNPDGTVTYTPGEDLADNVDSFEYEVCDDHGQCDRAVVTINANTAPLGTDDEAQTPRDTAVHIVVLANDFDAEGDDLSVNAITQDPANGNVVVEDDGTVTYTPNAGFTGVDTFNYEVCDPRNFCDEVVVVVEVLDSAAAPQPQADSATTPAGAAVSIAVTDNDRDPNGEPLTVATATEPSNGTAVIEADGTITYTPNDGFTGTDTFEYQVCDAGGLCAQAVVTVQVGVSNGAPVATDDVATTPADTAVTVDVIGNDTDPDGDTLVVASAGQPDNGTTVVNADGTVTYTPDAGFSGEDSFVYTACDEAGDCATATVTVTVDGADRAPVAVDDVVCGSLVDATTIDVVANDVDFDGDDLTVVAVLPPTGGTAFLAADGTITYTPPSGAVDGQWDVFTYEVTDGNGHIVAARVRVYLTDGSGAPVVVDDEFTVGFDTATTLPVLANDSDPNSDGLTVVGFTDGANGTVALGADGSLVYTPNAGFFGVDRLTYQVSDGNCGVAYGVVVLNVGDADGDGLSDADEQARGTDPNDDDSDNDGISDFDEVNATGPLDGFEPTDPMDSDSDDDGINDGDEANGTGPLTAPTDPNNPDTDADGIRDGTEAGVSTPVPGGVSDGNALPFGGTDEQSANWQPDVDPTTTTDPTDNDSDDDGLLDGAEDANGDGATVNTIGDSTNDGSGETDPNNADTDGDTLSDGDEVNVHSSNPLDTDTDNGTLEDGFEIQDGKDILDPSDDVDDQDSDGDGLTDLEEEGLGTDPNNPDSDGDGLSDGAEVNTHKTDPLDADTDDGGINDGEEVLSLGTDPLDPSDDGRVLLKGGGCEAAGGAGDTLPLGLALLMLGLFAVLRRREGRLGA